MQQRIRMARLVSASFSIVLAIVLFATGEWVVGLLILALAALLLLRVLLVRDVPSQSPRPARHGGDLPPPDAAASTDPDDEA